jgi:hypothetical protein
MNTDAVTAAPAPAAVPVSILSPVSPRKKADTTLEDTGRWILIVLYVFGLLFPFVGALLAYILL